MPFVLTGDCPNCGEPLAVRRRRKDGERFIGCSAFPQCRWSCDFDLALQEALEDWQANDPGSNSNHRSHGIDWDRELRALITMVHPDRPCDQNSTTAHLNYLRDRVRGKLSPTRR
jgi:ssDNA-binding Zn-finger/Zn-ribbon topoisomerase 1